MLYLNILHYICAMKLKDNKTGENIVIMLHTHEVTGSNPVRPTKSPRKNIENQGKPLVTVVFFLQAFTAK